jgi:hypothetical protein
VLKNIVIVYLLPHKNLTTVIMITIAPAQTQTIASVTFLLLLRLFFHYQTMQTQVASQ